MKQQIHKADVTLQLKESMFLRKETDLKHSIKLLQSEVRELNEQVENDDQSQSSLIFKKIVGMSSANENESESDLVGRLEAYKKKEQRWTDREKELSSLLRETTERLKKMKDEKTCDCVFQDTLLEKMETASWESELTPYKKQRQKSDEERLSSALELSRQRIESLVSSNESLSLKVESLGKELNQLKVEYDNEIERLKELLGQTNNELEQEFDNERKILKEKHGLEIQKILLIEEVCFGQFFYVSYISNSVLILIYLVSSTFI